MVVDFCVGGCIRVSITFPKIQSAESNSTSILPDVARLLYPYPVQEQLPSRNQPKHIATGAVAWQECYCSSDHDGLSVALPYRHQSASNQCQLPRTTWGQHSHSKPACYFSDSCTRNPVGRAPSQAIALSHRNWSPSLHRSKICRGCKKDYIHAVINMHVHQGGQLENCKRNSTCFLFATIRPSIQMRKIQRDVEGASTIILAIHSLLH